MLSPELLQHLLDLAAKTGDRLIVVNSTSAQTFVLMSLKDYEAIAISREGLARRALGASEPERSEGMPVGGRGGEGRGEGGARWSPPERAAMPPRSRADSKSIEQINADLSAASEPMAEPIIEVMAPPPVPTIPDEDAQKFYFEPV